jgi:hypothetical protein
MTVKLPIEKEAWDKILFCIRGITSLQTKMEKIKEEIDNLKYSFQMDFNL